MVKFKGKVWGGGGGGCGGEGGREGGGVQIDCDISFQERRFTAVLRCCLGKLLDLFETFRKR